MGLYPKFYFIGASLIQYGGDVTNKGWIAQLREKYSINAELVIRGFAGYNTEWIKPLFDKIVSDELSCGDAIPVITILLGSNDSSFPDKQQHVPLEKYKENLRNMIAAIKKVLPDVCIFLVTPPPLNEPMWEVTEFKDGLTEPGKCNARLRQYADAVISLCEEKQAHVINLWEVISSSKPELFFDGLHFSDEGNALFAQKWLEGVRNHCPTLLPENIPAITPHWSQMKKAE
ncbi:isoamyl acetate-hydrolyzing esterase [Entomophthora muscae]|uniref:Isoamyl acetate-hydrolyzing esterase n=1 Tax=Entomophthora muscae TaxID=34485 RepID=A0ACC2SPZ0_9FUNG|nr:isoamyl acetate-hydrolyzing esterase [Entomophthora muscae]